MAHPSEAFSAGETQLSLRIAGNTAAPCVMAIQAKGYEIIYWTEQKSDEAGEPWYLDYYEARKDGRLFSATSPEELLGLIALWETRGDDWRTASDEEWAFVEQLDQQAGLYNEDGELIQEQD